LTFVQNIHFDLQDTWEDKEYNVRFVEVVNGKDKLMYSVGMKKGMWASTNRKYLGEYYIELWDGTTLRHKINVNDYIKGRRVFISFDSSSLGDNIAWMPYCLEFKKHYKCDVIVSTFKNFLFEKAYPELEFVNRGVVVDNIVAMFELGWFWDKDREPVNPITIPLQKSAANILGLPYKEIKPRIDFTPGNNLYGKYVTISTRSTAQCKHWYYWPELISWLKEKGYRVIELSKEADDLGAEKLEDTSLENVMNVLHHSAFYIGLSSGISWLAWALNKEVFMIANFSKANHEFSCHRITNENVCNGCWNNPMFKFDKGNWNWCPEHEDTPRQFECHKSISVDIVKERLSLLSV
jgi:autotransporter strand-loop-strand O-heptosyltransferase